jgi:F0F1-type ATP synthase assembly protein I
MELAVELVGTPLIFGFLGLLLDRRLGTSPLFVVVLGLFGIIGMGLKTYFEYAEKMRRHEEGKPWAKS